MAARPNNGRHTPPKSNVTPLLPHNREAEESLLGAMLLSDRAVEAAIEAGLTPADFYDPNNGHLFDALLEVHAEGVRADAITVHDRLERAGLAQQYGGMRRLTGLMDATLGPGAATNHAGLIRTAAHQRHVIALGEELVNAARTGQPVDHIVARLTGTEEPGDASPVTVVPVHQLMADPPTPKPLLVEGLLARGEMMVLAAARASNKSWAAMSLAMALADGHGMWMDTFAVRTPCRVMVIHGEMDASAAHARWSLLIGDDTISANLLDVYGVDRVRVARIRKRNGDETTEILRAVLPAGLEQAIAEWKPDVLIIDPWAAFSGAAENSNDETDAVMAELSSLLKRHNITLIATHHFSKAVETREAEDLWRGASLLADRVHTRITLMPYYKPADYRKLRLDRREARRYATATFLCRTRRIPDDITLAWDSEDGRFHAWQPPDADDDDSQRRTRSATSDRMARINVVVSAISDAGGAIASTKQLMTAAGWRSWEKAEKALAEAADIGAVHCDQGPHGAKIWRLTPGWDR